MSQLPPPGDDDRFPPVAESLLQELRTSGAGVRETWTTMDSLASRTGAAPDRVLDGLRWLAANGYIRQTAVDGGEIVQVTDRGRVEEPEEGRVTFRGTVVDGKGEGRYFMQLAGYARQFRRRLGYEPYPGTLNLELTEGSVADLDPIPAIPIEEWEDDAGTYGAARCYPASLETSSGLVYGSAHVLVPERTDHDETTLEAIAPTELRASPDIATGESLTIHV